MVQSLLPEIVPRTLAAAQNDRSNNFDFLRFLMATLVLYYHSYPLLLGGHQAGGAERVASFGAGMAVDFFFVMSGFLVTQSWVRTPSAAAFLRKRVLRIYPAFLGVSLFCAVVIGPLGAASVREYVQHFHPTGFVAYALLLVGPYLPPVFLTLPYAGQVDGSFWTLRYEFECYLLVLALGLLGTKVRRGGVVLLLCIAMLLALMAALGHAALIPNRDWHLIGNPFLWQHLILFFLTGMAFYLFRDHVRYALVPLVVALAGVIVGAFVVNWQVLALAGCGSYLLFWIAFYPVPRLSRFARYGDFSYGIYLYGYPVQQTLILYYGPHLTPLGLFCLAFPIALALAALSWHLVEAPALRLKRGAAHVVRA